MERMASQSIPKITVVIPLHNHEKFVKEAVHSVLEQSFSDLELIILNDGSTDSSEDVVKSIRDDRIRYFYQDNRGTHHAINRGIHLARVNTSVF
jgi:glycosyltransferase involved in cell wall biosynthesis